MVTPAIADDGPSPTGGPGFSHIPSNPNYLSIPNSGIIAGPLFVGAPAATLTIGGSIAVIPAKGGSVRIDWDAAKRAAEDANPDPFTRGISRALLAARDGTWVAMDGRSPAP